VVCKGARTTKVVEGGGEEKHVLISHQLDDGGIGRGVTTTELQPLGKVMPASSGSHCKRCITLIGGRRRDSDINDSIREGGGGGMALLVGVKEKADVGGAGGEGSRDEVTGFGGDGVAGDDETSKGGEFAVDRAKGVADGVAWGGFVVAAGKKVVAIGVNGAAAEAAEGMGKELGENGQAEVAEEAQAVVGGGEAVVRVEAVVGVEAGEIMEGRGHHGVGKGGKVRANVGRGGERGGEGVEILALEAAVDVAAEVRGANSAISEVGKGGRSVKGRKMGDKEGGASRTEEGALATGVGGPGKEVCAVCKGEIGDMSRRVRVAVGGEENRASVGDDKGGRGCQRGGAIAKATEVDR
jgi:hypothetical protein